MWYMAAPAYQTFSGTQTKGRMGGQLALNTDASGVAREAYFTTLQGKIFRVQVPKSAGSPLNVKEILQTQHVSFQGAALQTYSVPGMPLQKRLYVTGYNGFGESPDDPTNAIYTKEHMVYVSRVNLNVVEQDVKKNKGKPLVAPLTTLQEPRKERHAKGDVAKQNWKYIYGCPKMCTGGEQRSDKNKCSLNFCANTQGNFWGGFKSEEDDKNAPGMKCFKRGEGNKGYAECRKGQKDWGRVAKPIFQTLAIMGRPTRLAIANGKLYSMTTTVDMRAQLRATDATLVINCGALWQATDKAFQNWKVDAASYGKALQAPGKTVANVGTGLHHEVLNEITATGAKMPWQFQAFKKVVRARNGLVTKEMICSRPRMPTTRPSQEKCCVRKRQLNKKKYGKSLCPAKELMKQL